MDELTIPYLGETRARWQYPFRALQASGAAMCAGSDWPVSSPNPFLALHVAVNRTLPAAAGGYGNEAFLPDQAIDLTGALANYTSGSARVNGVDEHAGFVRTGYDADLAVADADLAHISPGDIHATQIKQTWVRGQLAYERS
jgi:predicted amidohydrolase YtcJ